MSKRAGITLIEILIAVSLLSLLSVGMMMAMRIGFNTMEKTDAHLVRNRRVSNARKLIENEIAGLIVTTAEFRPTPENVVPVPFVQWEGSSMRFVTAFSLQDAWRGRPQIAALQVVPGDRGQGVRLIVNETPYTGPAQSGQSILEITSEGVHFAPILPGAGSFVLADRLAWCRFSFEETTFEPPYRLWRPDWKVPVLPLGIRIDMAPLETAPSELRVSSVTVPININRDLTSWYSDAQ